MLRLTYEQRRAAILSEGVAIANATGLETVSPRGISTRCSLGTSRATVRAYFRTQAELWLAIARHKDATDDVIRTARKLGLIG